MKVSAHNQIFGVALNDVPIGVIGRIKNQLDNRAIWDVCAVMKLREIEKPSAVLRAGNGLLEGMLDLIPSARVGHIGLYRDPKTLEAHEYYFKMPPEMPERDVLLVDDRHDGPRNQVPVLVE